MKWLRSLPIHLLIAFMLLIMALPSVALILHAGLQGREDDLRLSTRATTYLLDNIASELNAKVDASRQTMELLSVMPEVRGRDGEAMNRLLKDLQAKFPIYADIIVVDRQGTAWASAVPGAAGNTFADRKSFIDAGKTGRFASGEYAIGRRSKKPIMDFAFPLKDRRGAFDGAILFGLDLNRLGSLLQTDRLPPGTSFGIFDHRGIFLYRTIAPDRFIGKPDLAGHFEKMKNGPEAGILDLVSDDGIHRLSAYRKIRLSPKLPPYAYIRGGTPVDIMLQDADRSLLRNLGIMFLLLVLVFGLDIRLSKRLIVDRIAALESASRALASGDLRVRVDGEVRGGELGRLGRSFDEMAEALSFELGERTRNEEALREKSDLLELAHDAIILLDLDGTVLYWNLGAAAMYGYAPEEAAGKVIHTLLNTAFATSREEVDAELLRNGRWEGRLPHTTASGNAIVVSSRWALQRDQQGRPWRIMEINSDITEREKSQQELLKMQKLESLGVLAGGIAHDFNNILTGVMGNISLSMMSLEEPERVRTMLQQAEKACLRACELSNQLLTFAKGGKPIKKTVAAKHLVEEAVSLVLRGSNVLSDLDLPPDLDLIEVDEGQMHQALNNIVINAVQSMPEGGRLIVTAANVSLAAGNPMALPAGDYVRFSFRDTGCGISAEDQKKIFDPYFTTKAGGKGLGLSSAHSVILRHGGYITVDSAVGAGSTFEILLPALRGAAPESQPEPAPSVSTCRGNCTVLVMDDEEMIRVLMSEILGKLGCKVTTCGNGSEAVSLYAAAMETAAPFDVVVMDLTIPGGMGGKEAASRILELDPEARLVVSSGYSNDPIMSDFAQYGFKATMVKPYRACEVAEVLAKVLPKKTCGNDV